MSIFPSLLGNTKVPNNTMVKAFTRYHSHVSIERENTLQEKSKIVTEYLEQRNPSQIVMEF